jgi:phosphate:Na+ symporter
VDAKLYSYQLGVFYIDFISECEKLGDYILNVVQATKAEKM